jgi:hypothetical protein
VFASLSLAVLLVEELVHVIGHDPREFETWQAGS